MGRKIWSLLLGRKNMEMYDHDTRVSQGASTHRPGAETQIWRFLTEWGQRAGIAFQQTIASSWYHISALNTQKAIQAHKTEAKLKEPTHYPPSLLSNPNPHQINHMLWKIFCHQALGRSPSASSFASSKSLLCPLCRSISCSFHNLVLNTNL